MKLLAHLIPGIGGILAAWLFLPRAIVDRGPYLQVVGHDSAAGNTPVAVGSGPETEIRLTESGVAPLHGWLIRSHPTALRYIHASTSKGSQRIRAGAFPGQEWNSFDRVQNGDEIRVYHNGRLDRTDVLTFLNGRIIELSSEGGETRATVLPDADGHGVPLADRDGVVRSWLMRCNGVVGFSTAQNCRATAFKPLSLRSRMVLRLRAPTRAPGSRTPQWLHGGWIRKGREIDNAFVRVNGGPPRFVPEVNEILDPNANTAYVLYRSGRRDSRPRIARSGAFTRSIVIGRGATEIRVGETDVAPGEVLALGDTYFQVQRSINGEVTLRAVEKHDRFHFFYSLSAGRLNFSTRLQPLPHDARRPLTIEGVSGAGAATVLPPTSTSTADASDRTSWRIPLAARFGTTGGMAPAHTVRMRITNVHAQGQGGDSTAVFANAPRGSWRADLFPPASSLSDGVETRFGGHILVFHRSTPRYEQIGPPAAMCIVLLILGYVAAGAIFAATSSTRFPIPIRMLSRAFALVALACIFFLIVTGVLMMARMAAHDLLIGKADYYHRQLFYSYLTAVVIVAIIGGIRPGQGNSLAVPAWMGFPVSLRILLGSAGLLLVWQWADCIAFRTIAHANVSSKPILAQLLIASALTLLFILTGLFALSRAQSRPRTIVRLLILGIAAMAIGSLAYYGMRTLAIIVFGMVVAWSLVYIVGRPMRARRLGDILAAGHTSKWRDGLSRLSERLRRLRERWGVLAPRPWTLILTGVVVLASGAAMGSGRDGVGVKPAEFAVWFLAPGVCSLLALEFRRQDSTSGFHWPKWLVRCGTYLHSHEPKWLLRAFDRLHQRWQPVWSFFARWRWQVAASAIAALILFLVVFYGRVVSPALILSAFVPLLVLLTLAWWTARADDEERESQWIERLRRSIRLYVPVLLTILAIELVVNGFYAAFGDFGPLLVLMPSIGFLTFIWALSPDYSEMAEAEQSETASEHAASDAGTEPNDIDADAAMSNSPEPKRQIGLRLAVAIIFLLTCLWGGVVAWNLVQSPIASDVAGPSATRATKRFLTRSAPWFTKEGSWSTDSLWIANGFYDNERMIANLHSDLVFVALVQSFGARTAILVLAVFGVLVALSLASLGVKMSRWSGKHPNPTVRLQTRRTTLLLYFAGIYVAVELIVHVGSSLNAIWQTGVTLPWISSGGSASIGFGGLCAIAIALAVTGLSSAEAAPEENAE